MAARQSSRLTSSLVLSFFSVSALVSPRDNTVQMWDTRTGSSVRSIYGPHLCGDALSLRSDGREALTASWREVDALQRWDLASGKLIDTIPWNGTPSHHHTVGVDGEELVKAPAACMLYACAYSPDEATIAAGGCGNGVNQAKLFDAKSGQPTERITFEHGVYSLAFAPSGKKLAIGGVDPTMSIISLAA